MLSPREDILNAMFALLQAASPEPFVTTSRKFIPWNKVAKEQRPALIMISKGEESNFEAIGTPTIDIINVVVIVYAWARDADVPVSILNPYLDAFDKAIAPNVLTGRQDLGGIALGVWKEGRTLIIPGDLDGDAQAYIPIKIAVP